MDQAGASVLLIQNSVDRITALAFPTRLNQASNETMYCIGHGREERGNVVVSIEAVSRLVCWM
jgi:hypothetical protein